jgi:hypothetical protein
MSDRLGTALREGEKGFTLVPMYLSRNYTTASLHVGSKSAQHCFEWNLPTERCGLASNVSGTILLPSDRTNGVPCSRQ